MNGIWTTADYALMVSLCSGFLSLAGFVWNVWSKFIFPRPKLRVRGSLCVSLPEKDIVLSITTREVPAELRQCKFEYPACLLQITNFGPNSLNIIEVFGERRLGLFRKRANSRFSLYRRYPPTSGECDAQKWITYGALDETKINVGETLNLFFPVTPSMFTRLSMNVIVVRDGLQRRHYLNRSDLRELKTLVTQHVSDP